MGCTLHSVERLAYHKVLYVVPDNLDPIEPQEKRRQTRQLIDYVRNLKMSGTERG